MAGLTQLLPLSVQRFLNPEDPARRVVPRNDFTARLTLFSAAAMAFLATFVLALSFAAGRLADRWDGALSTAVTIRVSAPADQLDRQIAAVKQVLDTTPGISSSRLLTADETRALLSPWFGPDLPVETLPIPAIFDVRENGSGFDAEGLRLRLQAEAPGAVLDDHDRWRKPLVTAASRLRLIGVFALALIGTAMAAMVTLAAQSALAANGQVIRVLRLVGAKDTFIARAFTRRFTLRALGGAAVGTALAVIGLALVPSAGARSVLVDISFSGTEWFWPLILPLLAAVVAFVATRGAALRALRRLM